MSSPITLSRVLVTGGQGFLGAYVLRQLIRSGAQVASLDVSENSQILEQVLEESELKQISQIYADIADGETVAQYVLDYKPTAIIHLAGVQIPTVRANPLLGASVNVVGTVNIFEAVRRLAEKEGGSPIPVSYASSAAVLGPSSDYPNGVALPAERDNHRPRTLYGVFKLCNEGTARIFWQDHAIPSVGLRPLTVFGVGREVGLTSGPTKAAKAAVLGRRFEVEVTGTTGFHYVDDVARLFVDSASACADKGRRGAHVFGVKGHVVPYEKFMQEIALSIPEVAKLAWIKPGASEVPIHGDIDEAPLEALLRRRDLHRPLREAVGDMVAHFQQLRQQGRLHEKDLGDEPPSPELGCTPAARL